MIQHLRSTPAAPSKVVVLGASGFVGTSLVSYLAGQAIETVALSSSDIDLSHSKAVEYLVETVGTEDSLVFVSGLTPDKGRDVATLMKNLKMAEHVATFLEKSPCAQVVYISSDAVYSDASSLVQENTPCDPASFHGLMHLARERILAHTLTGSDVPFLVLRPSLLYGAGDTHNGYGPNRFLRTARAEQVISLFGDGEEKRDHLYVKDLSKLIGLCLVHRSEGVLNVATGASLSFYQVAQTVAGFVGDKVQIKCLPRASAVTHRHFDLAETFQAFPYHRYTSFRDGISETMMEISDSKQT